MTRDQAVQKVRKLLRLGKSSNVHEAAAALRQAQALMRQHALEERELEDRQPDDPIRHAGAKRRGRKPNAYEATLIDLVRDTFGVMAVCVSRPAAWIVQWCGPQLRAELADYAFVVLLRQLERDRRHHLRFVRVAKNRAARGDVFGLGWIEGARRVLTAWQFDEGDRARIARFVEQEFPRLVTVDCESRLSKAATMNDHALGRSNGARAQLNRGVSGSQTLAIEGPR